MEDKPIRILIIEDDELECERYKKFEETNSNVKIIGITNSSNEGLKLFNAYTPDATIVDIELHKGQGSGLDFIENIRNSEDKFKPIIVVTTNAFSTILYNKLHDDGVDLVFYKKQLDYSPKLVVSTLFSLRKSLYKYNNERLFLEQNEETLEKRNNRISNKIETELDFIGISSHLKGRQYIYYAIMYLINQNDEEDKESVFTYLSNKYKRSSSSISRVMQTAINYAWRNSSQEDIEIHYATIVNYHTGVPSSTEFIYYYAKKIKNSI